jgi:hypothetical protein
MGLIRSAALSVIKSFVPLNLPYNSIISTLSRMGLTYRRTDMLADIRSAYGRSKYQTQIERLTGNQYVPEDWMYNEKLGAPYNYRIQFRMQYYDPETGQVMETYRHMFHDDYLKNQDYINEFPYYLEQFQYEHDYDIVSLHVSQIAKNTY